MKQRWLFMVALTVGVMILAGGCQAIFTTSAFTFAQRDPSDMTLDQKINFAEEALASGDLDAIESAYDALKDDAAATTDADLQLLVADLAMELAGFPDLIVEMLPGGSVDLTATPPPTPLGVAFAIEALVASLDSAYLLASKNLYEMAFTGGADVDAGDYLKAASTLLAVAIYTEPTGPGEIGPLIGAGDPLIAAAVSVLEDALGPGKVGGPLEGQPALEALYDFIVQIV